MSTDTGTEIEYKDKVDKTVSPGWWKSLGKRLPRFLIPVGTAILAACAPQPPKEATSHSAPTSATSGTEQPIETQSTQSPEPTNTPQVEPTATPKPAEPTKTPEPPRVTERFFQEVGILDIYTSDLFIVTKGKIGKILISRLPDDSILLAYNTLSARTDGKKPTPIGLVPKAAVRGAGFQFNGPEKVVVLLQEPNLGGQVEFKNLPGISEPALFNASKQGNGADELYAMLAKIHGEVDPRLTQERAKDIVTTLYKGPLEPSK